MLLVRTFYKIDEKYPNILSQAELFANPTVRMIAKLLSKRLHVSVQKTRMRVVGGLKNETGYNPFIQTYVIKDKQFDALAELNKKLDMEIEEIMFSVFAFLGAKVSGERNVFIQCLISKEEGIERRVNLEQVRDFNDLLGSVAHTYREKYEIYRLTDVEESDEKEKIFLSYAFNQDMSFSNLKMLDLCMSVNVNGDEVVCKMLANKGMVKQEFSEKIFALFTEIIINLLKNS